jgi:hypothetical protein
MIRIYGMVDPRTNELRYVGKTGKKFLSWRMASHLHDARRGMKKYVCNWLRELLDEHLRPEIFVIEEVGDSDWEEAERFWIAYFRSIGAKLTNTAGGGQGNTRALYEKRHSPMKGRIFSEEHKRRLREGFAQARQKRSESRKELWRNPEYRAKMLPLLNRARSLRKFGKTEEQLGLV